MRSYCWIKPKWVTESVSLTVTIIVVGHLSIKETKLEALNVKTFFVPQTVPERAMLHLP